MTLSRLSWRNAQRQARDYLVYFVTVVMAAALIYAFNGLVFSQEIAALSTQMRNLPLMIVLASLAVVAVVGDAVIITAHLLEVMVVLVVHLHSDPMYQLLVVLAALVEVLVMHGVVLVSIVVVMELTEIIHLTGLP